jgi:ubiquinone/menaquinone biosynthesis C-methylase UbiE
MYNYESYKLHEENIIKMIGETDFDTLQRLYFEEGFTSSWLVNLLNKNLDPLLESDPGASWLTIGDGRYGSDAHYLIQKGFKVMATDISDIALKIGFERGFINQYQKENAEHLSFIDKEFDYCVCKEALHHFPRPYEAIYEMLRVCRKGIVLMEPYDMYIFTTCRQILFRLIVEKLCRFRFFKKFLGEIKRHTYEDAGNYVYKFSRREIEKIALGLNLHYLAFKDYNMSHEFGAADEKIGPYAPGYQRIKRKIKVFETLSKFKFSQPTNICVIIFTEQPSKETMELLRKDLYEIIELPENPKAGKKK